MSSRDSSWLSSSHCRAPWTEECEQLAEKERSELTASGLLDGELRTVFVEAHFNKGIKIGRHRGGYCCERRKLKVMLGDGGVELSGRGAGDVVPLYFAAAKEEPRL